MRDLKYYVPGILLIAIAFLIVAFPEILVALMAALLLLLGIGMLRMGHRIRKSEFNTDTFEGLFNGDFYDGNPSRSPLFIRWYQRF
jgi:hypothetical protein